MFWYCFDNFCYKPVILILHNQTYVLFLPIIFFFQWKLTWQEIIILVVVP